ncbi:MAG: ATP-binding protein, partial [Hyphomonas sp.]|uniref:sensor histidine kinase n=1 Tax=Hyphomonas sp. TaxID=87 RepID=UPI0034A01A6C
TRTSRDRSDIPVTITVDGNIDRVLADPIQVQQVVINLVRNALDAMTGRDNARIDLRASLSDGPGYVEIEVCDNGPGLSPEMKESIFKPFATTKAQGMGLGLSICQTIVEAHGGTINAVAAPQGGTCFRFTLRQDTGKPST